jgi:AraC family transcriptional regulator
MTPSTSSLNAYQHLNASMTACSWSVGWRSLLLRAYIDPPRVDEFMTPPTADQLIVLVIGGSCDIEARYGGRVQRAHYETGHWHDRARAGGGVAVGGEPDPQYPAAAFER